MSQPTASAATSSSGSKTLSILLAMAMFVLVVDTSMMNVSISAVVNDVGATVSGVQSAIALEALVSAAFILIGSKIGDLYGRKRAYIIGLLGYAIGAVAMTLTQSLTTIIIFWAIIGGLGASLLLPAGSPLLKTAYIEAVATAPAYQGGDTPRCFCARRSSASRNINLRGGAAAGGERKNRINYLNPESMMTFIT